ncbi:helix-turn-helix domain-containing protein [Kozakia baliensis]|nr:hypothetical protein [Kozakia baliensis]
MALAIASPAHQTFVFGKAGAEGKPVAEVACLLEVHQTTLYRALDAA